MTMIILSLCVMNFETVYSSKVSKFYTRPRRNNRRRPLRNTASQQNLNTENSNLVDARSQNSDAMMIQAELLNSTTCTTESAFNHALGILNKIQHYKKLTTKDGSALVEWEGSTLIAQVPGVLDAKYEQSGFRHAFVSHAPPVQFVGEIHMNDCFDENTVTYLKRLERVTEHSDEFVSGCTPFRQKAMIVSRLRQCIVQKIKRYSNNSFVIDEERLKSVLKRLARKMYVNSNSNIKKRENDSQQNNNKKFYKSSTTTISQDIRTELELSLTKVLFVEEYSEEKKVRSIDEAVYISRNVINDCVNFEKVVQPVDDTKTKAENSRSNRIIHEKVPDILQSSMQCLPVQSGAIGMIGNGLEPHFLGWISTQEPKLKASCEVHPICSRLASEKILKFNNAPYDKYLPSIKMFASNPSFKSCLNVQSSNCRFHTFCWLKSLRHVCAEHSYCCPSLSVYEACRNDIHSKICKSMCKSTS